MTRLSEENQVNPFSPPRTLAASEVGEISLGQYKTVRLGLQMILISIGIFVGFFVLAMFSASLFALASRSSGTGVPRVFATFCGLMLLAWLLTFVGGFFMTLASPRANEKPIAIASVTCFLLAIGAAFVGAGMTWFAGEDAELFLYIGASILSNISTICFCLLLRRIGQNISSSNLENSAYSMLVWYAIFFNHLR